MARSRVGVGTEPKRDVLARYQVVWEIHGLDWSSTRILLGVIGRLYHSEFLKVMYILAKKHNLLNILKLIVIYS